MERAAKVADVKAAPAALVPVLELYERGEKIWADQGYRGELAAAVQRAYECILALTTRLGEGLIVEPWRWVVERTFAWLENARRLCRDYQGLPEHHEGVVYVVMIRLMLRWLTNNRRKRKLRLN